MTKKHFAAIAAVVAAQHMGTMRRALLATALADVFEKMNPNFDRARFLRACEPQERKP